jgi:hypothetical protein
MMPSENGSNTNGLILVPSEKSDERDFNIHLWQGSKKDMSGLVI